MSATITAVKFNSTGNLQFLICNNNQQHKHHYIGEKYNTQKTEWKKIGSK